MVDGSDQPWFGQSTINHQPSTLDRRERPMNLKTLVGLLQGVLTAIGALVPVAEYLFDGAKRGPEKRTWVIDQASGLLSQHVGAFWGGPVAKGILGLVIDGLVACLNSQGNLSTSGA